MKSFLREALITIAMAVVIFFILQSTVSNFVIVETCMEPNFVEDERILVNKVIYRFGEPERGDVIILHPPLNPETLFIKRVVGLPGETVEVKDGTVYINGKKLDEPYIKEPPRYTMSETKIPQNEYFVLGDNRNNANDSHNGWTVPRQSIIGKAWLSVWPISEWELIPDYPLDEQLKNSADEQTAMLAEGAIWQ